MLKLIETNTYIHGYNFEQLNCIDIPLASATGHWNYDNYFFYSFLYCFFNNWSNYDFNKVYPFINRNIILNEIGFYIKGHTIRNKHRLHAFIQDNIDQNHPILFIAPYKALFYTIEYLHGIEMDMDHGFIITGYHKKKSLVIIKDVQIANRLINPEFAKLVRSDPVFPFQLTYKIIDEIWKKTYRHYLLRNRNFFLFTLHKNEEAVNAITSYVMLIKFYLENYNRENNSFLSFVNNSNLVIDQLASHTVPVWIYRKSFVRPLFIFFDCIEKAFALNAQDTVYAEYNQFKLKYLEYRSKCVSLIYTYANKQKHFTAAKLDEIRHNVCYFEKEMYDYVKKLYAHYQTKTADADAQAHWVDFAKNGTVKADSYFEEQWGSRIIDGKEQTWRDAWISDDTGPVHWAAIDLKTTKKVRKIVVKHYNNEDGFLTKDYQIQGSHDEDTWETLATVKGNQEFVNIHNFESAAYRYFRLYITLPGLLDLAARIYAVEIWGAAD